MLFLNIVSSCNIPVPICSCHCFSPRKLCIVLKIVKIIVIHLAKGGGQKGFPYVSKLVYNYVIYVSRKKVNKFLPLNMPLLLFPGYFKDKWSRNERDLMKCGLRNNYLVKIVVVSSYFHHMTKTHCHTHSESLGQFILVFLQTGQNQIP